MGTPEGFIIDPDGSSPLNLGNSGSLRLAALTVPPAPKRPEWASNADTDGQALVRNPLHDNRTCTMQVRVSAASMDAAMTALGTLQGKLQEACIQGANNGPGLKCNWTPSGATHTLALYMVFAEITDLPVTYDDGWFASQPVVTVSFQCKPFLYGAEVTGPTASGTSPLVTVEVDSVPGDVPAEARLVVTDGTAQPRRWVEWGLESLYYNASHPAPLFVDSASVVTSGFAGAGSALTGAFGGSAISAALIGQPIALCSTGALGHVGSYRIKARIHATSTDEFWRLSWKDGDGGLTSNEWVQPIADADFSEIDLGMISVGPVIAGTQIWSGQIEAYTTTVGGEIGAVDYLALLPVDEGYGRMEAVFGYLPGIVTGHDEFITLAAGTALNGHVAPIGGTWATSGATTDFEGITGSFIFSDLPHAAERLTVTDSSPRIAVLGSTTFTDIEAAVDFGFFGGEGYGWVVARYVDSSNYLRFGIQPDQSVALDQIVSGTKTNLATVSAGPWGFARLRLRLIAFASGRIIGTVLNLNGLTLNALEAFTSVTATGGTLASGKAGFAEQVSGAAIERVFWNFSVGKPSAEPLVINPGKSLEVRSDSNLRQSTDGASYGDVPSRGSRLLIPQAGNAGRSTRIAVRAIREDPVTMASRNDGDSTQLAVFYTPRYLAVPRS